MTEDVQTSTGLPAADDSPGTAGGPSAQERVLALANERPETAVGAAFAGGLLLAMILKRLGR